jgi:hypothetical protein
LARVPNEIAPRVQQVYKEYQREAMPVYKGGIREYIAFQRECKNCVAPPGRDEAWQLIQLQNKTPEQCNLSNVETLDETWERLDSKYATSTVVSSQLVNNFIELKLTARNDATKIEELQKKLKTLFYDLKAVNQEGQATQNTYIPVAENCTENPQEYQRKYAAVSIEKKNLPGET